MSVQMVRARVQRDRVEELQAAAEEMFAAVNAAQPDGLRYASCLLPDGETFLAFLQIEDGAENPLPAMPEWRAFIERVETARAEPADVQPLQVVGSYRLF